MITHQAENMIYDDPLFDRVKVEYTYHDGEAPAGCHHGHLIRALQAMLRQAQDEHYLAAYKAAGIPTDTFYLTQPPEFDIL